jgi:hypothetical protein
MRGDLAASYQSGQVIASPSEAAAMAFSDEITTRCAFRAGGEMG